MIKTTLLTSIALTIGASAQIKVPQPSPATELEQVVGVTNFKINYSRPSMKDREIFGGLVPYDALWRTGANAPTKISFDTPVTLGGKDIPAGEYVLFTIPGKDEWTVIVYGDTAVPNTAAYDQAKDVARIVVKPEELSTPVESFTIGFDDLQNESATLELDWANVRVPVAVSVNTNSISEASIKEAAKDMASWKAADYAGAARFYAAQDMNMEQAVEWIEKALEMNEDAFWWQHSYAQMLAKQGKKAEAIAAAEKSLAGAKANPGNGDAYVKLNEALLSTLR